LPAVLLPGARCDVKADDDGAVGEGDDGDDGEFGPEVDGADGSADERERAEDEEQHRGVVWEEFEYFVGIHTSSCGGEGIKPLVAERTS